MKRLLPACLLPVLLLTASGEPAKNPLPPVDRPALPTAKVPVVRDLVQPTLDGEAKANQAQTKRSMNQESQFPANFKLPVIRKGLTEPWLGLMRLEEHGLAVAAASSTPALLLDRLSAAIGKPAGALPALKPARLLSLEDHVAHAITVLDRARDLFDKSTQGLKPEHRKFLFDWAVRVAGHLGPQAPVNDKTRPMLKGDRTFISLVAQQVDWVQFVGAAQALLTLQEPAFLDSLRAALQKTPPLQEEVPGVTGQLLFKRETKHGLVLIGGGQKNTYDLKKPVALLIDLAGDDVYRGKVASPFDADHPLAVVLDLAGDDLYEGEECGVATGRMGVGLLVDVSGKDVYKLATGSGGVGLAGIGMLLDHAGDDLYEGSRRTQGSAIAGIGLLLDRAGNDRYTAHGFSLGFGGPLGVGAVIDLDGDDVYQCGSKYGSGYNKSDAPGAKPGDASYQYDSFGLAMGMGRRVFPPHPDAADFNLAGGLGLVIDLRGKDRYESSNFSQACGYFFGVGLKMDLAGDDEHIGARYGLAAGAHFGMGLLADYAGNDRHTATGPVYTGACAWDHSVFMVLDAEGDDVYDFKRSSGPCRGDIGSWSVFADLRGKDRYLTPSGLARTSGGGLAIFLDAGGDADDYREVPKDEKFQPADGKTWVNGRGGVFIDR
jgi:hypothetical protein